MTVQIPIISEFDGTGVKKAVKEFKQLETVGAKAQFALKKAALPAAAALGALAAGMASATKGAIEDAAAQKELARQLEISTSATDAQVASVEDWISAQGTALGVADDELRPAFAKLARATYSIKDAQEGLTLAMDISAATGKDLGTVTTALEKAYGGNLNALAKLDPSLRQMIKDGASLSEVMDALGGTFGGAAAEAANTAQGGFKRLALSLSETKESIGAALLPIVEALLPKLQGLATWAQDNPDKFVKIAAVIGGIATAVMLMNGAMAAYNLVAGITTAVNTALATSFTAVQVASGLIVFTALIAAIVALYVKFQWFRDGIKNVVKGIVFYFQTVANAYISMANLIIKGINLLKPGKDIPSIPLVNLVSFGGGDENAAGGGSVPKMAKGGVVTAPTMVLAGEAGPEAIVPLNKMRDMGGDGVTINVNGGDPQAVVDAITRWYRQNGPSVAWMR